MLDSKFSMVSGFDRDEGLCSVQPVRPARTVQEPHTGRQRFTYREIYSFSPWFFHNDDSGLHRVVEREASK